MYKATRAFINDRQKFAKFSVKQVTVKQVGGGAEESDALSGYSNAHRQIDRERNIKIVSGWLVMPYNRMLKKTEIRQHWWNIDANSRTYFDVSPGVSKECEYVLDMDMAEYGITHFDDPAANVCHAVYLSDDGYTMVDRIFGELFYKPIDALETAALFKKVI